MNTYSLLNPSDPLGESAASNAQSDAFWSLMRVSLAQGNHVLAHGPAGTGKTRALMREELGGRRVMRIQCQEGATAYEILGQTGLVNGSTRFEPGAPIIAIENGWRTLFDEIDHASEDLKSMIYAFGDGEPFALPDGRIVTPHPRFQMCACTNLDPYEFLAEGPRDRFDIFPIHEPAAGALAKLPACMRESARRAVRHRVSGLRAWYRFARLLGNVGLAAEDALSTIEHAQGLVLPEEEARERVISTVARVAFGEENGDEIVRAWRVAAAREGSAPEARRVEVVDIARANYDAGYEAGYDAAIESGEVSHEHDSDSCEACEAMWREGYDAGEEAAEHNHDIGSCSECEAMYDEGYASAEHEHEEEDCYACRELAEEAREEGREEGRAAARTCGECGLELDTVAHACTEELVMS